MNRSSFEHFKKQTEKALIPDASPQSLLKKGEQKTTQNNPPFRCLHTIKYL